MQLEVCACFTLLSYNCFPFTTNEPQSYVLGGRNHPLHSRSCDEYNEKFDKDEYIFGRPVHMDKSIIDNWYPKTFAQRVDYILLCIYNLCKHIGQSVELDKPELFSLFFIDRQETDPLTKSNKWREEDSCSAEAGYMLETLTEEGYIKTDAKYNVITSAVKIALTSKGYSRVDSLQKNMTKGNNTLVAMKFGDETIPLREAIRKGIHAAGYNAIF